MHDTEETGAGLSGQESLAAHEKQEGVAMPPERLLLARCLGMVVRCSKGPVDGRRDAAARAVIQRAVAVRRQHRFTYLVQAAELAPWCPECRLPGGHQELQEVPPWLAAGCSHREQQRRKPTARLAIRAEPALAPQQRRPP